MTLIDAVVCVDLGKSRCRVSLRQNGEASETVVGEGLPGLAATGAVASTVETIEALRARLGPGPAPTAVGVGAAGALTAPAAAARLARLLAMRTGARAAVTSDIVTAHVGAFDGAPGVCLVVGTGAVAFAVAADGSTTRHDGLGPAIGDFGSGAWIGREGLRAAAMAEAGSAPATGLADRIPRAGETAAAVAGAADAGARLARLAPTVLAAAEAEDPIAAAIVARALDHLAATAQAATVSARSPRTSVVGGLTGSTWFRERLENALAARSLIWSTPIGDALEGARIVATRTDLPHEGVIHRVRP